MDLVRAYAAVIADAEAHGFGADFAKKLVQFMKSRGHLSLLPRVLRVALREPKDSEAAVVLIAKESDAKRFSSAIQEALGKLGAGERHQTRVDPRAVGGFMVRRGSRAIDRSFRSALASLYRRALS